VGHRDSANVVWLLSLLGLARVRRREGLH
jgi:MYXO-CTERM domain-containing protein